jgi:hypothetical protein
VVGLVDSIERRYSPGECRGTIKGTVSGKPDEAHISTSYVERQNLTMRMSMRRFTRLTNALSKKVENHIHMVSLYAAFYNFIRRHKALRVTPAMQAGLVDRMYGFEDILAQVDAKQQPKKRGPYRPRVKVVAGVARAEAGTVGAGVKAGKVSPVKRRVARRPISD